MKLGPTLAVACLMLAGLALVAPGAGANHCPVNDALEPVLRPLGQCYYAPPNRAPAVPYVTCENPLSVGEVGTCCASSTDPDGDGLQFAEFWMGDGNFRRSGGFASGGRGCLDYAWANAGSYCVEAYAQDSRGMSSEWSDCFIVSVVQPQRAPVDITTPPSGPTGPQRCSSATWTYGTTDADGDRIQYDASFTKDGTEWYGDERWASSGATVSLQRTFCAQWEVGTWCLKVRVRDDFHAYGPWSPCKWIQVSGGV